MYRRLLRRAEGESFEHQSGCGINHKLPDGKINYREV